VTVPNTVTDPVWSLQPWPVSVTFAGHLFEVPAVPAVDWLQHLMSPDADPLDAFPGMLSDGDQELINDALLDGAVSMDDVYETCLNVITNVSGRPWWVTLRLVEVAKQSWHSLGAEMLLRGVDATKLSLSGWLDVLLLLIMRNIDPKDAMMFTMKLEQVPPELAAEQKEPEISRSDFMAMA